MVQASNGIAPPGPLTNISGWENFKEEMDMYFVVVKEDDDKTKLITLLYQGGSELRRIWKTVKPGTAETTEIYKKSIALLSDKRAEVMENRLSHATQEPAIKREPEECYYNNGASRGQQKRQNNNMFCYGCGSSRHIFGDERCGALGQNCHSCGAIGHFSTVCRKGRRQSNSHNHRGRGSHQVKTAEERNDCETYGSYQVYANTAGEWLFKTSQNSANHSRAQVLVDTYIKI